MTGEHPPLGALLKGKDTSVDYFADSRVIESMPHEHAFIWAEMLAVLRGKLPPGYRVADLGCSAGEFLRMLCDGMPGSMGPTRPAVAVGLERPEMRSTLQGAVTAALRDLPIVLSTAALDAFPGQFDLIVSHEVIYLLEDLDAVFRAAYSSLRPGGLLAAATAGYMENEYYHRWLSLFEQRGITAFQYGIDDYVRALREAGFDPVEARPVLLSDETYRRWRALFPFSDSDWFLSEADEHRYFTQVGKRLLIGRKAEST
jgi:SAM-dependent methyltransferase